MNNTGTASFLDSRAAQVGGVGLSAGLVWLASSVGAGAAGADYLAPVAFVPLYLCQRSASFRRSVALGLCAGVIINALCYSWLGAGLARLGVGSGALSAVYLGAFVLWQACQLAMALGLATVLRKAGVGRCAAFASGIALTELLYPLIVPHSYSVLLVRFSYGIQLAEVFGRLGLTWALLWVNACLGEALLHAVNRRYHRSMVALGVACLSVAVPTLYGMIRAEQLTAKLAAAARIDIGIVQLAAAAEDKATRPDKFLSEHLELSRAVASAELIVWPETTLSRPVRVDEINPRLGERLLTYPGWPGAVSGAERPWLLTGAVLTARDGALSNSVVSVEPSGYVCPTCYSAKQRLVPFVETERFTPSASPGILETVRGARVGTLVCFEALFPNIPSDLAAQGAELLVNVTNDAWGTRAAARAHLALAQLRAVEQCRNLVRASASGISAFISPTGAVVQSLDFGVRGTIRQRVPLLNERTLYSRTGDWPWAVLTLLAALLAGRAGRKW